MIVTFHHPPKGFTGFDPSNPQHYNFLKGVPGIYIYGLRLEIDNQGKKFVPLYVGIAKDLKDRLYNGHYKKYKSGGKGVKDLWDFSQNSFTTYKIYSIYSDMFYYDYINNYRKSKPKYRESQAYMEELKEIRNLLFFQNLNYFNVKFGSGYSNTKVDIDQSQINDYFKENEHTKNILLTKCKFDKDFYFVYANLYDETHISIEPKHSLNIGYPNFRNPNNYGAKNNKDDGYLFSERVEKSVKSVLNQIGIHTTAKAEGKNAEMEIDFTKIQDNLINVGKHPFGVPYKPNSLIINIP